jgi:hypothetical protein
MDARPSEPATMPAVLEAPVSDRVLEPPPALSHPSEEKASDQLL